MSQLLRASSRETGALLAAGPPVLLVRGRIEAHARRLGRKHTASARALGLGGSRLHSAPQAAGSPGRPLPAPTPRAADDVSPDTPKPPTVPALAARKRCRHRTTWPRAHHPQASRQPGGPVPPAPSAGAGRRREARSIRRRPLPPLPPAAPADNQVQLSALSARPAEPRPPAGVCSRRSRPGPPRALRRPTPCRAVTAPSRTPRRGRRRGRRLGTWHTDEQGRRPNAAGGALRRRGGEECRRRERRSCAGLTTEAAIGFRRCRFGQSVGRSVSRSVGQSVGRRAGSGVLSVPRVAGMSGRWGEQLGAMAGRPGRGIVMESRSSTPDAWPGLRGAAAAQGPDRQFTGAPMPDVGAGRERGLTRRASLERAALRPTARRPPPTSATAAATHEAGQRSAACPAPAGRPQTRLPPLCNLLSACRHSRAAGRRQAGVPSCHRHRHCRRSSASRAAARAGPLARQPASGGQAPGEDGCASPAPVPLPAPAFAGMRLRCGAVSLRRCGFAEGREYSITGAFGRYRPR